MKNDNPRFASVTVVPGFAAIFLYADVIVLFSMTSDISITSGDNVTEVGVRLPDIKLTYDKDEHAYLGEGDLMHTHYRLPLGETCWIKQPIYRSDRFFIRVEVDEYFDAAPDVRLFIRMRGMTAFTMAGAGAVVACRGQRGSTRMASASEFRRSSTDGTDCATCIFRVSSCQTPCFSG